jgi:hypothetical protein
VPALVLHHQVLVRGESVPSFGSCNNTVQRRLAYQATCILDYNKALDAPGLIVLGAVVYTIVAACDCSSCSPSLSHAGHCGQQKGSNVGQDNEA